MADNENEKRLIKLVDKFYQDVIDDFKEAEVIIINESKFSGIFRHKDYDRNIRKLRSCKKKCLSLSPSGFKEEDLDEDAVQLLKDFERARFAFINLCDAHIQVQNSLKSKSEGEKVKYSVYKEVFNRMQQSRKDLNASLHELDIDYTDFNYVDESGPVEGLRYEDLI